ncbi:MAG: LLM class flavin-dependent oxidoreductase [Myxococcota bacterium]|nr:LLM class flavin-dependent oxidoreductase [Myxococcota bacterium]
MTRFGLLHLFESPGERTERQYYNENIELVEYADDVGLDEVWLAEHHFTDYGVMPSTQVFGSWIAARTKQIRIGTAVTVLPFHNPIRLAEEFAFLDQLSDGRLDFGVGRGYQPGEFRGYGIPFEESRTRFNESLEVIKQAWTQDAVNFQGQHYQFDNVMTRPRPFQAPHPPIFGASFNPDTIKYQAMQGLNLLFTPLTTSPEIINNYRNIMVADGRNLEDHRIGGLAFIYVHEDREKALRDFAEPCMWYFRTFTKMIPAREYPEAEGYYRNLHHTLDSFVKGYDSGAVDFWDIVDRSPFRHAFLVGDPEYVRGKLDNLLNMYGGLDDLLCWTRLGGLDHTKVMSSMDLFVNKVIKPLKQEGRIETRSKLAS